MMFWKLLALLVITVITFFSGRHLGREEVTLEWQKDKIARDAEIVRVQRDEIMRQTADADRIRQAEAAAVAARGELDHIRAATRLERLRCTAVPDTGVSAPAGQTRDQPPADGELSGGVVFDPGPGLRALADRADSVVEACRTALNMWPGA